MKRSQINDTRQAVLGVALPQAAAPSPDSLLSIGPIDFHNPPLSRLFVGTVPLKQYLLDNKLDWIIRLRGFLFGLDWSAFAAAYTGMGRKPGHPALFVGLIVYGMLEGKWSLRELEQLAVRDLGAWWICGGLTPDHSTIGKFINLHAAVLTEDFFISLTREIYRSLGLTPAEVAGDGTVIESAGSRFKLIKAEAARQAAAEAAARAAGAPGDREAARAAQRAGQAAEQAELVGRKAKEKGRDGDNSRVCSTDPDAVLQKQKNGKGFRPSYKPSVFADWRRLIVGQRVEPSDENAAVAPMFDQYQRITGGLPERMMFDAGYFNFAMLERSLEFELDLLCPSGKVGSGDWEKKSRRGRIVKKDFTYDAADDEYLCPEGRPLKFQKAGVEKGLAYRLYRCLACTVCRRRSKCTDSKEGRTVKRYEQDELKEAMVEVMKQPRARQAYRKRQAMVEPVFSPLKGRQGLTRFRRFGINKVRLEFSLHCIAYNVGRLLLLERYFALIGADLTPEWREDGLILRWRVLILLFRTPQS